MSLPVQSLRLNEVAEAGMDLGGFDPGMERIGTPTVRAIGECCAFENPILSIRTLPSATA